MKTITPHFTRDNGRLEVEYQAEYDGNTIGFFRTNHEAEVALDDYVLGLCEQGLIDAPLAALEPDEPGQDCPDHGPYADDDCPKCLTLGAAVARQIHRDYHIFVLHAAHTDIITLGREASAYAAYLNSRLPKQRLDADHVLLTWRLAVAKHGVRP